MKLSASGPEAVDPVTGTARYAETAADLPRGFEEPTAAATRSEPSVSPAQPIYRLKADFFKTLGHPARIRVLEILRDGEASVSELLAQMDLEPSHLSQQLGVLRRAGVVQSRKAGASVHYSVADPRIFDLLKTARSILSTSLKETSSLLGELEAIDFRPKAADPA
jgi:DNA-binding transcriptional ArsR family regulator